MEWQSVFQATGTTTRKCFLSETETCHQYLLIYEGMIQEHKIRELTSSVVLWNVHLSAEAYN